MKANEDDAGRTGQVMKAIRQRVTSRALAEGDRLPSIRAFARTMDVSSSTVVEAYDRLAAEGLIRARRGSGFFVARTAPLRLAAAPTRREREIDPFWVSRQSLDAEADAAKPGCGWLPTDWMPVEALRRACRALSRAPADDLTDYGTSRGASALRRALATRFADEGIPVSPEQVLLTGSGSAAIDLVCRLLVRSGDCVLVDDPCYFNFRALLRAHGANVVGVPYTATGPDPAVFETIVRERSPRLYLTNSALHNPTGATLTPQVAHRLLNVATRHGVTIVEDDIFADFEPDPSPRFAALDGLERVIRVGSFSKTLSASFRCGYVVARPEWVEGLVDLQIATGFTGPGAAITDVVAHVLAGGGYRKHIDEVRRRLARARTDVARRLHGLGIEPWLMPRGGFYLWCRLPDGRDAADLARSALEDGVVLAPGNVFSVAQTAPDFMRFNVAHTTGSRVWTALQRGLAARSRSA